MKAFLRALPFLPVSLLLAPAAQAQYTTPGTGLVYDLNDLVALSGGVFTVTADTSFLQNANFTLAETDTLLISSNATWALTAEASINIHGRLELAPPDRLDIIAATPGEHFHGMRFEEVASVRIDNTRIFQGGGVKCLTPDLVITRSIIAEQAITEATGGALELSRGRIIVDQVEFIDNVRAAISSGANQTVAPRITNSTFLRNGTANSNRPQINHGPSGADTTIIRNNQVIGDRNHTLVGGIAFSSLLGVTGHVVIDSNEVVDNRYGIAVTGGNLTSVISNNTITDNNTQNNPMQGGSGINLNGTATNISMVHGNRISGSLWGATLQGTVMTNFGDTATTSFNPGGNSFSDNGNGGAIYALFNNTPNPVRAMNNCWDFAVPMLDSAAVAQVISDVADDATLGQVFFMPFDRCDISTGVVTATSNNTELLVYPNPSNGQVTIVSDRMTERYALYNSNGQLIRSGLLQMQQPMSINGLASGLYLLQVGQAGSLTSKKIVVE